MDPLSWDERPDDLREPVMVAAFGGWNDAGRLGVERGRLPRRAPRRAPGGGDRPGGVLRLPGHPPPGRPDLGRQRARSSGPRWRSSPPGRPTRRATWCWWPAPSPRSAGAPSAPRSSTPPTRLGVKRVVTLGSLLADVVHTRPVKLTGHGLRRRPDRRAQLPQAELRRPHRHRRRPPPGGDRPRASRPSRSGRRSRTTPPASPTPRAPSPCCAPSSTSAASSSTSTSSSRPPAPSRSR